MITEALAGDVPSYLAKLEAETQVPITDEGRRYREALRGDCHIHSTWSDGGATIEAMARDRHRRSATSTWCSPTTRPA